MIAQVASAGHQLYPLPKGLAR